MKATDPTDRSQDRSWTVHDAAEVIRDHAITIERHADELRDLLARTHTTAAPASFYVLQLLELARQVEQTEQYTRHALGHTVGAMRDEGRSWQEIAQVLGTSRQAAHERFHIYEPLQLH